MSDRSGGVIGLVNTRQANQAKVKEWAKRCVPNHQQWCAKRKAQSEYVHIAYTLLARLALTCMLQSVLSKEISASELTRKFIRSALLVG